MKALTVRQPWAWAIIHGGKDVENRTQAWSYRGPLAIHAGAAWSDRGAHSPLVARSYFEGMRRSGWELLGDPDVEAPKLAREGMPRFKPDQFGAIIGVVDLVHIHVAQDAFCCESPWAETQYVEVGGRTRRQLVHLELANPRPVEPIACTGRLGLWTPPADVLEQLEAVSS